MESELAELGCVVVVDSVNFRGFYEESKTLAKWKGQLSRNFSSMSFSTGWLNFGFIKKALFHRVRVSLQQGQYSFRLGSRRGWWEIGSSSLLPYSVGENITPKAMFYIPSSWSCCCWVMANYRCVHIRKSSSCGHVLFVINIPVSAFFLVSSDFSKALGLWTERALHDWSSAILHVSSSLRCLEGSISGAACTQD